MRKKHFFAQLLKYFLIVASLALVATVGDLTGNPFLQAIAGFAWPWLWVGFAAPFFFKSWSPVVAVILGGLMTGVGLDINVVFDMTIPPDQAGTTTPVMEMIAWMIVGTPVGAATALLGACARKTGWWSVAGTTVFGAIIAYGYYWEYSENYRVKLQLKGVSLWDNLTDYPQWIWAGVLAVINIVVLVRIARKGMN